MGACCSNRRPPLHVGIRYILQGGRTGLFGITISDQVVTGKRGCLLSRFHTLCFSTLENASSFWIMR